MLADITHESDPNEKLPNPLPFPSSKLGNKNDIIVVEVINFCFECFYVPKCKFQHLSVTTIVFIKAFCSTSIVPRSKRFENENVLLAKNKIIVK